MERLVRIGAYLLVGGFTIVFVLQVGTHGQPQEQATVGVPLFTTALVSYLLGYLTLTARRAEATRRVLATGVGAGVAAAALWLVVAVVSPPIPVDTAMALAFTIIATGVAVWANTGVRGGPVQALLAVLCATTTAQLLVVAEVRVLSGAGPAWLIPNLVPMAISPADVANSRIEINDPYFALLFLAGLTALALTIASIATRRREAAAGEPIAGAATQVRSASR